MPKAEQGAHVHLQICFVTSWLLVELHTCVTGPVSWNDLQIAFHESQSEQPL